MIPIDQCRRLAAGVLLATMVAAPGAAVELDRATFIGVDEIHPGMRGRGLTTFAGVEVSEFQVEVLGILRGWIPGGDMIVIEASGGPLAETGIYRGMSGSPVYLDGRLAGAVSYNLGGFGERPIGGVTPIAEMLPILAEKGGARRPPKDAEAGSQVWPAAPAETSWDDAAALSVPSAIVASGKEWAGGLGTVSPIGTPVALAGCHPRARQAMAQALGAWGMYATVGGGAAAHGDSGAALQPGAPVAVQIVRGDMQATALGTITHVDGQRLLAFGHPMFHAGPVELPMARARVFTVYPSQAISFVIGAAAQPAGAIVADRQTGIMGATGRTAPMVPVDIAIVRADGSRRQFEYELIPNKFFVSQFLGFLAFNSLLADQESFGETTLGMQMAVEFNGGRVLEFEEVIATTTAPQVVAQRVSEPLAGLLLAGIEAVTVESVQLELQLRPAVEMATIEEVVVPKTLVKPGEVVSAIVFLEPYEKPRRALSVSIPIPADAPAGPLLLRVCSTPAATAWEAQRAPARYPPVTLEQYIQLYREASGQHRLRLSLHADARGVVVGGREMMGMPPSMFRIMDTGKRTGGRSGSWGRAIHQDSIDTEWQLRGCRELRLDVEAPAVRVAPRPGAESHPR